ncbi:MAG: hypothetical protein AB7G75_29860 [Candidatus Binatia bacterium]
MQDTTSEKQKRTLKRVRQQLTAAQRVLTVAQYAQLVAKSERAAWQDIYRGLVPYRRQGRRVIILRDELEAFLKALPGMSVEEATQRVAERAA